MDFNEQNNQSMNTGNQPPVVNDYTNQPQPSANPFIVPPTEEEKAYQNVPYNPPYQPTFGNKEENNKPLSVGQWLVTLLILCIPCVNIIMLFVWAFGEGNKSRANYCKATLIFTAISFVLSFVLGLVMSLMGVGLLAGLSEGMESYGYDDYAYSDDAWEDYAEDYANDFLEGYEY